MLSLNTIPAMDPKQLFRELKEEFTNTLPESIRSTDDMWNAQKLLGRLASQYAFLMEATVCVKEEKRRMKRDKENADRLQIDQMMEREDILDQFCNIVKTQYAAVSRMVSIRQSVYDELKLLNQRSGN